MKRALKSYRRNKYNSSVKLSYRIDCLFLCIEKNYTKIFYVPLVVLVSLIVMKFIGYVNFSWDNIIFGSIFLYFPLGVMIPVLYSVIGRKMFSFLFILNLFVFCTDLIYNNNLFGTCIFFSWAFVVIFWVIPSYIFPNIFNIIKKII